jgi:hypothetical protein
MSLALKDGIRAYSGWKKKLNVEGLGSFWINYCGHKSYIWKEIS